MNSADSIRNDDRNEFAAFLRRLAGGKVGAIEWNRFVVRHYDDELLEEVRCELGRLVIAQEGGKEWSDSELAALQHWSRQLTNSGR